MDWGRGGVLLRHHAPQGQTIAAAERQLGVHRATVHRWIEAGLLDTDVDQSQVMKLLIEGEPTALGFSAYEPDVLGGVATGATRQAVERPAREDIMC